MYEGVDTVVLYNELAYQDIAPVQWQELAQPLDAYVLGGLEDANSLLLQACIAVEERPARDSSEDLGPVAGELARLDFKLNLILQLLGRLVMQDRMPPPTSIQFNAVGASWQPLEPPPSVGARGLLRVQLCSSLPQSLELPAQVVAASETEVEVKFMRLSQGAVELIQKLAFLRHRRHIADVRKARHA
jgi:hypothetical protein